jgi:peptide deformylase
MAIKEILKFGNPKLREISEYVPKKEIKSTEMKSLVVDMFDTMNDANGIGIAAPQIGVNKRVAIVNFNNSFHVMFNPVIIPITDKTQGFWEGCLSVPDMRGWVERPKRIMVYWLNEKGEPNFIETNSFLAAVFQHEIDHLDGSLYIDKVEDFTKLIHINEYNKIEKKEVY